jgi:hypothetical protein
MRRKLARLTMVLPLLLCAAVVVLWVRSYWAKDAVEFQHGNARWELASELGRIRVDNGPQLALDRRAQLAYMQAVRDWMEAHAALGHELSRAVRTVHGLGPPGPPGTEAGAADRAKRKAALAEIDALRKMRGTFAWPGPRPAISRPTSYSVPHWLIAAAAAIPSASQWGWAVRRRRARRQLLLRRICPGCGYDLRATPDRCPECGGVPDCAPPLNERASRGESRLLPKQPANDSARGV